MLRWILTDMMPYRDMVVVLNLFYKGMIMTGIGTALVLMYRQMVRSGIPVLKVRLFILLAGIYTYPAGILSARAASMFYHPKELWSLSFFFENLLHGKTYTFHACLILPFIILFLSMVILRIRVREGYDVIFVHVPLAHAIGRIGCLNVGCCWGHHITLSLFGFEATIKNPVPFYAILLNLSIFLFLRTCYRWIYRDGGDRRFSGIILGLYLLLYGVGRFILEFYRTNPVIYKGLTQAQVAMIAYVALGALIVIFVVANDWIKAHACPDPFPQKNLASPHRLLAFLCGRSYRYRAAARKRRHSVAL